MKRASIVEADSPTLQQKSGRLRLPFRIDNLHHVVHAVYHDIPELAPQVWQACMEEIVLACLVDLSTASLSIEARTNSFEPGCHARSLFKSAAEALRVEVLADFRLPIDLLPVCFRGAGRARRPCPPHAPDPNRVLLLMGGGKDSLYSYHLLRRADYDVRCFYLTEARRTWQQLRRVHAALADQVPQNRVYLDANRRGPVAQEYGWLYRSQFQIGQAVAAALPYALAHRCRYMALGLERSSDTPMFYYKGFPVNHQHQKSSSFIRQFNGYLSWRFGDAVQIISPLHGLYDTGIYARFISSAPELLPLQSSCGGANGRRPHCGHCDKCAFLAALLAGLGVDRDVYQILFPRDPLQNARLYDAWLAPGSNRPLTCAGFAEEVRVALGLARKRGWRAKVLDEWTGPSPSKETLAKFLSARTNNLVPPAMSQRLEPLLRFSPAEHLPRRN